MANGRKQWWRFLRVLPFMPAFQISLMATIVGLQLGMWFFSKYVGSSTMSPRTTLIGILYVVTVSMIIIVTGCYKTFVTKPPTPAEATHRLRAELLSILPLIFAGVISLYFMATEQMTRVNLVLWPGLLLWMGLRLIFYKRANFRKN